jgi:hypothetical protein
MTQAIRDEQESTRKRARMGWLRKPILCPVCRLVLGKRAVWLVEPTRTEPGYAMHPGCDGKRRAGIVHAAVLAAREAKSRTEEPLPTEPDHQKPEIASK